MRWRARCTLFYMSKCPTSENTFDRRGHIVVQFLKGVLAQVLEKVNSPTEVVCPRSLAFWDLGNHKPQPWETGHGPRIGPGKRGSVEDSKRSVCALYRNSNGYRMIVDCLRSRFDVV